MTPVLDLLESDHREIDDLLHRARETTFATDRAVVYSAVDILWARLAVHIRAEHVSLFPVLLSIGADENIVERLRLDHSFFMSSLARGIKGLNPHDDLVSRTEANEIRRLLDEVEARLIEHNDLEERMIYPMTEIMDTNDAVRLRNDIKRELDNIPPRFQR